MTESGGDGWMTSVRPAKPGKRIPPILDLSSRLSTKCAILSLLLPLVLLSFPLLYSYSLPSQFQHEGTKNPPSLLR
jgi:hypothetical protein